MYFYWSCSSFCLSNRQDKGEGEIDLEMLASLLGTYAFCSRDRNRKELKSCPPTKVLEKLARKGPNDLAGL